jgi:hypothetical protein
VLVLLGWATAAGSSGAPEAARTTAYAWLVANGTPVRWEGGALGIWPLGLAMLPCVALGSSVARLVAAWGARTLREALLPVGGCAGVYAVVVAAVAVLSRTDQVQPAPVAATLHALVVALLAGVVGAAAALRRRRRPLPVMPARPGLVLAGAVAALGVLVAAGALLVGASLAAHLPEAVASARSLHAGLVGGLLLMLAQAVLLPDAAVWGAAWTAGPGFGVGTGTGLGPSGAVTGTLPDLPLLAALPGTGSAPGLALVACAAPLLAGVAAGAVVVRRGAPRPDLAAALAAGAGGAAGLVLGLLSVLARGAAGTGHLHVVGPSPVPVGLAAGSQVALVAAATAWALATRAGRARAA